MTVKAPTTDEMDKTTPEDRNKLVGICAASGCGLPTKFERGKDAEVCSACGSNFATGSIVSQRTYNPTLHNKRKGKR